MTQSKSISRKKSQDISVCWKVSKRVGNLHILIKTTLSTIIQNSLTSCLFFLVFYAFYWLKNRKNIYINIGNRKKTTLSSRQACFVIAHSSGDFNDKNIHNHRLYTLRLHCWGKFKYV